MVGIVGMTIKEKKNPATVRIGSVLQHCQAVATTALVVDSNLKVNTVVGGVLQRIGITMPNTATLTVVKS